MFEVIKKQTLSIDNSEAFNSFYKDIAIEKDWIMKTEVCLLNETKQAYFASKSEAKNWLYLTTLKPGNYIESGDTYIIKDSLDDFKLPNYVKLITTYIIKEME